MNHQLPSFSLLSCTEKLFQGNSNTSISTSYSLVTLKPTPIRLWSLPFQWKHSCQCHSSTVQNPKLNSQVPYYMTTQHTGIASYVLILKPLVARVLNNPLLQFFVFILPPFSISTGVSSPFAEPQILGSLKWARITCFSTNNLPSGDAIWIHAIYLLLSRILPWVPAYLIKLLSQHLLTGCLIAPQCEHFYSTLLDSTTHPLRPTHTGQISFTERYACCSYGLGSPPPFQGSILLVQALINVNSFYF